MEKDPLDDAINNINLKLDEKFNSNDQKFDAIQNELRVIKEAKDEPSRKKWEEPEEDEASYITKGELRGILKEVVSDVKDTTEKTAHRIVEQNTTKLSKDSQVFSDFPEINTTSKQYNPKFQVEVENEMNLRVKNGRSVNDPDLLYDCAQNVWAKWVRQGLTLPKHLVERDNDLVNAGDDNFEVGETRNRGGGKPNAKQIELGRRMGLSESRLAQLVERNRKY